LLAHKTPAGPDSVHEVVFVVVTLSDSLHRKPANAILCGRPVGDIDAAFAGHVEKRSEVLLVSPGNLFSGNRMQIVALAAQHRVPALYFERDFAEAGGLMSYGPNIREQHRLLGIYTGRILSGQKPAMLVNPLSGWCY
jgi:hypothetical protein